MKKTDDEIVELSKAAERGDADAQCRLGLRNLLGDGMAKNFDEAAKWFLKAAEQGHPLAQWNLSVSYHHGVGVKKDENEALRNF